MSKRMYFFCVIVALFWFSLFTYVPIVPTYAVSLGSSLFFVGIISGAFGLTQMLLRIPLGIVSDRFGIHKLFIVGGIFFVAMAGVAVIISPSPVTLLVCRAFGGVAASSWVSFTVYFSHYFAPEEGPKAMGIINAANSVGITLAVLLCGLIADRTGKKAVFAVSICAGLVALVLSFFIKERHVGKPQPVGLSELAGVPFKDDMLLISILGLASQFMTFATLYGFTPIVAKRFGATDFQVGLLLMTFILPMGVSSFFSGALNKRFGTHAVMSACFTLFAVDCLLTPFAGGVVPLFIMTVVGGFAQGAAVSLLMGIVVSRILPEKRNTAMGFFLAVNGLGMFLGPVIVGIFSNYLSIGWGFAFTALVGIVSAGLSLRLAKQ